MNDIIVSLITGILTLIGVVITVISGNNKTQQKVEAQAELTRYRIEQLEKKQDKHNTLIERMYAAEESINLIEEKIKVANHRIDDLESTVNSNS
jgi:hypothetical protein